jgi:hypothetical protein
MRLTSVERPLSREQFVEDDSERVDVHLPIQVLIADLLGRHVRQLALDDARLCAVLLARGLGDAEVHHLHRALT